MEAVSRKVSLFSDAGITSTAAVGSPFTKQAIPTALHLGAAKWADLMELTTVPVIEDSEAAPNLIATFKK